MSEQSSQEPTMEEILASIRRIISEDEAPAQEAGLPTPGPGPEAAEARSADVSFPPDEADARAEAPAPETVEEDEDSDLELTQKVETHGDLDFVAPTEPAPEPESESLAEPGPPPVATDVEALVSDHTAQSAATAFGQLSSNILMPRSDRTLEDVVRELLRPLLQQWLDENLPGIVERAVTAEVERIARGRVR